MVSGKVSGRVSGYCPTVKLAVDAVPRLSDSSDNSDASYTPDISDDSDTDSLPVKNNNHNNINILDWAGRFVRIGQSEAEYRTALAAFKTRRQPGITRFRHDQACWAGEMFLNEWESLAVDFEWTAEDIFDPPRAGSNHSGGLAYWLGVDIVTALRPEHAVTETNRVFERN
jgi:hypothetical protein